MSKPNGSSKSDTGQTLESWDGAVLISIGSLVPCHWNVNEMDQPEFAALIKEVQEGGFDEPCQVVPIKDGLDTGKYLILGGEHRYRACAATGVELVPCVIKEHLENADEATLIEWSIKRNNIRGKINKQKYAAIEKKLSGKWQISAEAARQRMLVRDELLKGIKEKLDRKVEEDNEITDTDPNDIETTARRQEGSTEEVDVGGSSPDRRRPPSDGDETDGVGDRKKAFAGRRALLASLKTFAQEVLSESAETVEHGYLYFGFGGTQHLVVDEDAALNANIGRMVAACKANSDKVKDFLNSAISKELPQWE
jgi:uncharacterized ParB-like nuclease family protein